MLFGPSWAIVGIAYSTLRHIHVLIEYYLRRIPTPTLRDYARYHLLLPVMLAGPIHRLPHFQRQCERRRWSAEEFFSGAERALFGLAMVVVLGEYIGDKVQAALGSIGNNFVGQWLLSAIDWFQLYFRFAGLTSIALGLCLMIGLTLEENFNQPWRARNLVEFWTRWHMTLSLWCRDYVFFPVAAYFRSALIGIFCAMLVMGLWHQFSLFLRTVGFLSGGRDRAVADLSQDQFAIWFQTAAGPCDGIRFAPPRVGLARRRAAGYQLAAFGYRIMTPLYRLLAPYLGNTRTLIAMCLIYAGIIVGCGLLIGALPWNSMIYLDVRLR